MRIPPQMQAIGCVNSLFTLGAIVSGIYQGIADAKNIPIDPNLKLMIRYGPIAVNGLLGIPAGNIMLNDRETLDEMIDRAPAGLDREQAEQAARGCTPIGYPIVAAGVTAAFEYGGYLLGGFIGSQLQ